MNYSGTKFYFYGLLIGVLFVLAIILKAFVYPLIFALIFSVVFRPINEKILAVFKKREGLAAFVTTSLIILIIIVPFTLIGIKLVSEASHVYNTALSSNGDFTQSVSQVFQGTRDNFNFPVLSKELYYQLVNYAKGGLSWVLQNSISIVSGAAKTFVNIFVFLGALYFLLRDGKQIKKNFVRVSPMDKVDSEKILQRLEDSINSIVKGNLVVAMLQGVLTGIGFWIFGVSQPVIFGGIAAIAALVPALGTSLVFIPVIAFLFLRGEIFQAASLTIWWIAAVSLIDNFLGPKLISRGAKVHPFMIFLSVIGGIATFGPIGFFLGPLTVSLFFALLDIHPFLEENECEPNQ